MNTVGKLCKVTNCDWAPWNGVVGRVAEYSDRLGQYRVCTTSDHVSGDVAAGESLWLFPRELAVSP